MDSSLVFLKKLRLKNFCNFIDHTFTFVKKNGRPYHLVCFFGPNGCGKTTVLDAISLLTSDHQGRSPERISRSLQRYVRSEDYDPSVGSINSDNNDMYIEGTYQLNGIEYTVSMNSKGWVQNDLFPLTDADNEEERFAALSSGPYGEHFLRYKMRLVHFIGSNSDLSLNSFQLHTSCIKEFQDVVEHITQYKTECVKPSDITDNTKDYCSDVVLIKNDHRIHYKRMSSGERKICKSFSDLFNIIHVLETNNEHKMPGWPRILLVDELDAQVYYERHVRFINTLKSSFPEQQIFATTHSGVLIPRFLENKHDHENELWIDVGRIN